MDTNKYKELAPELSRGVNLSIVKAVKRPERKENPVVVTKQQVANIFNDLKDFSMTGEPKKTLNKIAADHGVPFRYVVQLKKELDRVLGELDAESIADGKDLGKPKIG